MSNSVTIYRYGIKFATATQTGSSLTSISPVNERTLKQNMTVQIASGAGVMQTRITAPISGNATTTHHATPFAN